MYTIENIAAYIIKKYNGDVTPMKLQKLLYYIHVWSLVNGKKVFSNDVLFFAWKYGPVNPGIYHTYKHFGSNSITDIGDYSHINSGDFDFINFILDSYFPYNAITLSQTTHSEAPWIESYNNSQEVITDDQILNFYSHESFAQNFPLGSHQKYFPPKTNSYYTFTFDMNESDSAKESSFSSIDEYISIFKKVSVLAQTVPLTNG